MIPSQFTPECYKMHIIAPPKTPNVKDKRKKKRNEKKEINKKNEIFTTKQKESEFFPINLIQLIFLYSISYISIRLAELSNIFLVKNVYLCHYIYFHSLIYKKRYKSIIDDEVSY